MIDPETQRPQYTYGSWLFINPRNMWSVRLLSNSWQNYTVPLISALCGCLPSPHHLPTHTLQSSVTESVIHAGNKHSAAIMFFHDIKTSWFMINGKEHMSGLLTCMQRYVCTTCVVSDCLHIFFFISFIQLSVKLPWGRWNCSCVWFHSLDKSFNPLHGFRELYNVKMCLLVV